MADRDTERQNTKKKRERANRKRTGSSQLCGKESKIRGAIHHKCSNHMKFEPRTVFKHYIKAGLTSLLVPAPAVRAPAR